MTESSVASSGIVLMTVIAVVIQVISFAVLILATVEYRAIIGARHRFLRAIGSVDSLRSALWQRMMLLFYIGTVIVISIGLDLLLYFQPHIL